MEASACPKGIRANLAAPDGAAARIDSATVPGCLLDAGMDGYVSKPFQVEELLSTMLSVYEKSKTPAW
jgi:CheY-like chemotaxis protein